MEPETYLQDNFDPSKLTIPNLRSILVEHEIYFASNANKQQLVQIFNDSIKPRAKMLLKKYKKGSVNPISDTSIGSNASFEEKLIPAKRQHEVSLPKSSSPSTTTSSSTPGSKSKRSIKKVRKTNQNTSFTDSSSNSFLSIEKFEINENDNIFKGPIDNKPINLLPQTKFSSSYRSKTPTKKILENFENSIPSSKKFSFEEEMDNEVLVEIDNKSLNISANEIKVENNLFDGKKNDIVLLDDIYEQHDVTSTPSASKRLNGPINPILDNDSNVESERNPSNKEDYEVEGFDLVNDDEKLGETIVQTFDVKSLTSFEDNGEISISEDSILVENAAPQISDNEIKDDGMGEDLKEDLKEDLQEDLEIWEDEEPEAIAKVEELAKELKNPDTMIEVNTSTSSLKRTLLKIFSALLIFSSVSIYALREIDMETGFCEIESNRPVSNFNFDIWEKIPGPLNEKFNVLKPSIESAKNYAIDKLSIGCKPCPENGKCEFNTFSCKYAYTKSYKAKSLFGLLPLRGECIFDTLREEKIYYLSQYTLKYLHENNERQISLSELHDYLKMTKEDQIKDDEFESYWNNFVEEELKNDSNYQFDVKTNEVTISHKIPTEYSTNSFFNEQNGRHKTKKLFHAHPPTDDLRKHLTNSLL